MLFKNDAAPSKRRGPSRRVGKSRICCSRVGVHVGKSNTGRVGSGVPRLAARCNVFKQGVIAVTMGARGFVARPGRIKILSNDRPARTTSSLNINAAARVRLTLPGIHLYSKLSVPGRDGPTISSPLRNSRYIRGRSHRKTAHNTNREPPGAGVPKYVMFPCPRRKIRARRGVFNKE